MEGCDEDGTLERDSAGMEDIGRGTSGYHNGGNAVEAVVTMEVASLSGVKRHVWPGALYQRGAPCRRARPPNPC